MKKIVLLLVIPFVLTSLKAQQKKRVLFLGNSYTYVNNLPQIITDMAASTGDTLLSESNCIGGYTLNNHSSNRVSIDKIKQGNWDYVVLQEQSQLPSFPDVEEQVFPYAKFLDSLIHVYNPCAETIFYMTWGRKNGDASNCNFWPPVCTYEGMDSLLNLNYKKMAEDNKALLCPVGEVWKYIRKNQSSIELYQPDESHPSEAGSYLAATCFYTMFYKKNPIDVQYNISGSANYGLTIKSAVKSIVYDNLAKWNIGKYYPKAAFDYNIANNNVVAFSEKLKYSTSRKWYFGDGDSSIQESPEHTYKSPGKYMCRLIAEKCSRYDTAGAIIEIKEVLGTSIASIERAILQLYPNPAKDLVELDLSGPIKETEYFISDHTGRVVIKGMISRGRTVLNIIGLPPGIYHIHAQSAALQQNMVISR